ncbi:MAG: hypothetical protein KAR39_08970 [Thermoplasmata archaeon]|nr:hypothetical protein [Thermoplasmata archaeon]
MKRAPLYILIAVVVVIVAVLAYFVYLNLAGDTDGQSSLGLVCSVAFIAFAFIAIELLFKPHLFLRPREDEEEESTEDN